MIMSMLALSPGDWTMSGLLSTYLPVFLLAWVVALVATPIMRRVALETGVVDRPDEARKMHRTPVAYLGGIAVFLGVLAGIAVSYLVDAPWQFRMIPLEIVLGMMAITITGVGDDIWDWDPRIKVAGQLVAAALMAFYGVGTETAAGFIDYFNGDAGGGDWRFSVLGITINLTEWIGVGIIATLVLGGCNASNLIDGLDGLLAGTTWIIAAGLLVISLFVVLHLTETDLMRLETTLPEHAVLDQGLTFGGARIAMCLAIMGAVTGFLAWNFNPAVIFLGDAGSLLLGYCCVTVILMLGEMGQTHFVLAGLIVFGLPIVDTVLAIFRRKVQGLRASDADANHLHHVLKRWLGTVKQAVFGMWAIEAILAMIGVTLVAASVTANLRVRVTYIVFIAVFGLVALAGTLMGLKARRERSRSS